MKNKVLTTSFLLLAVAGLMFTACKKEYSQPPIQDLPVGKIYTIGEILDLESGYVFTEDASVYGIVTADEQSGNFYKTAFLQDRASGDAIELYLTAPSGVRIGDSIRVYLKDVTYSLYFNLPQLTNFQADGHIVILANNKPIPPKVTTIANITAGHHLAELVRLENVKFTEQNTFAEPNTYGNRTLIDALNPANNVIVRTSNYANFAYDSLPQGVGNMVAIATVYNSTWQLYIRSARELEFDGYVPGGGDSGLPYFQDFSSSFGTYTTYSVAGDQEWEIDYNTAKMTGHVGSSNYANEDWLISAPVSLKNVEHVKVGVNYAAQYQNSNTEDVTLQISKDYVAGTNPLDANWIQMPVTYPNTANWSDFQTIETSLDEFLGETVTVAIKFLSSETQSRTFEIKYILVEEGVPGGGPTPPGPGTGGELQYMPYCQSFATDFGTYMTYDVLGTQSWENKYDAATITGYVNGSYYANEDWLISSPVAIMGVEHAKMTIVYIGRYFSNINNEVTIWASTNYTWGTDPTTTTWTQVPTSLTEGNNWSDFLTTETSLDEYLGQTVTFAVKYTSTDSKAGTMEIQSICIEEGSGEVPPTPPTPGEGEGSGTADDPYNVAAGIGLQSEEPIAWVHGYIVGAVKAGLSSVTSNADINWSAPFDLNTNVVIADDASCREISQCIIVNLPAGKPLRTQVNLVDNSGNLGKHLAVNGKLRKYFGQAGLRDSNGSENDFVLEGGDTPPTPPTPGTGIFSESFANGQGEFTIQDVDNAGMNYVWTYMSNYHCMKANGYYQGAHTTESWLVSPEIDLTNVGTATLKFDHAVAFASAEGSFFVMASTDYSGDVTTATWTELNIGTWPEPNPAWVFEGASANLSGFVGQKVTIAFKYTSTTDVCPAWEVKNVVVE